MCIDIAITIQSPMLSCSCDSLLTESFIFLQSVSVRPFQGECTFVYLPLQNNKSLIELTVDLNVFYCKQSIYLTSVKDSTKQIRVWSFGLDFQYVFVFCTFCSTKLPSEVIRQRTFFCITL